FMLREDLIALGLHSPGNASQSSDDKGAAFTAIERLLTLLRDVIAVVDLQDDGTLGTCIEECLRTVSQTRDLATIRSAVDVCADACSKALARLDRQLVDQKKEIATLLNMVQDALAIVSGDSHAFARHVGDSMDRFEALARLEDIRQLKAELVREVAILREIATERQK